MWEGRSEVWDLCSLPPWLQERFFLSPARFLLTEHKLSVVYFGLKHPCQEGAQTPGPRAEGSSGASWAQTPQKRVKNAPYVNHRKGAAPVGKGTASIHTQITLPSHHCHFKLLSAFPPFSAFSAFVFLPLLSPTGPFLQCVLPFPPSHLLSSFPLSLLLLQLNFLPHHELSFSFSSFLTSTTAEEHMPFHRTMVLPGRHRNAQKIYLEWSNVSMWLLKSKAMSEDVKGCVSQ